MNDWTDRLNAAMEAARRAGAMLRGRRDFHVENKSAKDFVTDADRAAYAEAIATATEFSHSIVRQASALLASAGVENPHVFLSTIVHSSVSVTSTPSVGVPAPVPVPVVPDVPAPYAGPVPRVPSSGGSSA